MNAASRYGSYCNWTTLVNCSNLLLRQNNSFLKTLTNNQLPFLENFDYVNTNDTNNTTNISTSHDPRYYHQSYNGLSVACYTAATTICAISSILALSNFLVIWVVLKTPFLRSKAVNMLIVNLCFIDLIASCIDLPLIWSILHVKFSRRQNYKWLCNW